VSFEAGLKASSIGSSCADSAEKKQQQKINKGLKQFISRLFLLL